MRKTFLFALLLAFAACHPAKNLQKQNDDVIEVTFLHLNDVYEISPLSDGSGGLARVAALRKELLAKNPNTITVLSGDFISPSVIGTLKYGDIRIRGKQMIETMNSVGVDWVVFGNHEFDYDKIGDLQSRLDESDFTWLGANVRYKPYPDSAYTQPFFKNRNGVRENCPDNKIVTLRDADGTEIKLGVFGVLINTGRKPWAVYEDWNAVAKKQYDLLKNQTDVCVALTHINIADDLKLAGELQAIPLYMGGHDHENMLHRVGKSVVAKADANAKTAYIHTLRYNKKTKTADVKSELRRIDGRLTEDPATAAVVEKWEKIKLDALKTSGFDANKNVTTLKTPLDCREVLIRYESAPLGDVLGAAMLAASRRQAQCAILNSGSVRIDDVLSGSVAEIDVVRMLPFGGGISDVEIRGSLLKKMLDTGRTNKGGGGFLQWKGVKWLDSAGLWQIDGQLLDENNVYKVILPDFLLTGNEQNMSFMKAEPKADGNGTTNPDVVRIFRPAAGDKTDLRADIRLALIDYWRKQK